MTCVVAVVAFFFIADFPEDAKWLTEEERAFVIHRLAEDQGDSDQNEPITLKGVMTSLSDLKLLVAGFIYFGPTMAGYGKSFSMHADFSESLKLTFVQGLHTLSQPSSTPTDIRQSKASFTVSHHGLQH